MRYEVTWPSSDDHYCAVTVVKDDDPKGVSFTDYSDGRAKDIFDVSLYGDPGAPQDEEWRSESEVALRNLVTMANVGLKSLETPRTWTYVWETPDGPDLGGLYSSDEEAMTAAFEEWVAYEGGNLGGYDEGTREEFDSMYAESGDIWITRLG